MTTNRDQRHQPLFDIEASRNEVALTRSRRIAQQVATTPTVSGVIPGLLGSGSELVFSAAVMASFSLPSRDPGDVSHWTRQNGALMLSIRPYVGTDASGQTRAMYPYGVIPRRLLNFISTEVKRTGEREVPVGKSLNGLVTTLGLANNAVGRMRCADQLVRTLGSGISITETAVSAADDGSRFANLRMANVTVADSAQIAMWDGRSGPAIEGVIHVSEAWASAVADRAFPMNAAAYNALCRGRGASTLRIDLYAFLTWRLSLPRKRDILIPWEMLDAQFGGDYHRLRDFKHRFTTALGEMETASGWSTGCSATPQGLLLPMTATPHVAPSIAAKTLRASNTRRAEVGDLLF